MTWRATTILLLAALVFPATGAAPATTRQSAVRAAGPLLGMVFEGQGWKLARIDPVSLEPGGKRVFVGRSSGSWAFSPDRSLLAVSSETLSGNAIVRLLDPVSLRQPAALRLAGSQGPVSWPVANRIVALSWDGGSVGRLEVVAYNPLTRRLLRRAVVNATLLRAARTPAGLALLLGPPQGFASLRLVLANANGVLRSTKLDVVGGRKEPDGEPYVFEQRVPGLAVDPQGGRVFVVPAEDRVLEIDLATLAVREHRLSQAVSLLGRLRNWLEPAAQAKASEGPVRTARWLGHGLIAVSGSDGHATVRAGRIESQDWFPAGLRLIDTQAWSVQTVDDQASGFVDAEGLLLATGSRYDAASGSRSSIGLVAYAASGEKLFSLFPNQDPWVSAVIDGKAYVGFGGGPGQTLTIVDLATGAVVGTHEGIVPQLLLGSADPWWR